MSVRELVSAAIRLVAPDAKARWWPAAETAGMALKPSAGVPSGANGELVSFRFVKDAGMGIGGCALVEQAIG
jgi:hypothetical protein